MSSAAVPCELGVYGLTLGVLSGAKMYRIGEREEVFAQTSEDCVFEGLSWSTAPAIVSSVSAVVVV